MNEVIMMKGEIAIKQALMMECEMNCFRTKKINEEKLITGTSVGVSVLIQLVL